MGQIIFGVMYDFSPYPYLPHEFEILYENHSTTKENYLSLLKILDFYPEEKSNSIIKNNEWPAFPNVSRLAPFHGNFLEFYFGFLAFILFVFMKYFSRMRN